MGTGVDSEATFVVADTFAIEGRGLVLAPGFSFRAGVVRVGDHVRLHRPDGTTIATSLAGLEMIDPAINRRSEGTPILVRGLSKSDVPIGTVVSLTRAD